MKMRKMITTRMMLMIIMEISMELKFNKKMEVNSSSSSRK